MVYIDILDDIVGEYHNAYHRTIKMKPIDVKDNTFVDSMEFHSKKEVNDKDSKSKVGDHVRISKHKNIFATGSYQIGLRKFLLGVKLEIQFHGHMLLIISMVKKLLEHFMKKNYKRLISKNLE